MKDSNNNDWKFFDHYKGFEIYVDETGKHFIRVKPLGGDEFTKEYLDILMDSLGIKRFYDNIRELADKDLLQAMIAAKNIRRQNKTN